MNKTNESPKESLKENGLTMEKISCYSEEEQKAIRNPEQMTKDLFLRCISTSIRIDDFQGFMELSRVFPDYHDIIFAPMDPSNFDLDSIEVSDEEIEDGINKLKEKLRQLSVQD